MPTSDKALFLLKSLISFVDLSIVKTEDAVEANILSSFWVMENADVNER